MFSAIYRSSYRSCAWIAFGYSIERLLSLLPMPSPTIAPLADASPIAHAGVPAVHKARFWDRIAVKYAADPIADMAGYEATLRRVQGLLSADQDVLEIGCGTGSTALRLAPFTRRMLATDVSTGIIAIAREKLAAQPVPQLSFDVADADAAVAGLGEYDVALAFNVLHLVTDLDRALELAIRALRPGGLLISKTACISEMNPLIPYLALPLMRAIGKAPHALCFDAAVLQLAITRQGMDIVSVERHGTRGKDFRVFIAARKPA
jgi:ubiquinone/menaquinone biosynthesis C-methylase UbiE